MVSIRYFLEVGEFCKVKSRPRGRMTSKTGAGSVAACNTTVRTQHARNKAFIKLSFLQSFSISRKGRTVGKVAALRRLAPRRFPFHESGWNQNLLGPHRALRGDPRNQKFCSERSNAAGSLINCGEWNRQHVAILNIARPDHCDIVGKFQPCL